MKSAMNGIGRRLVDLVRQADLLHPPLVHHGDAVRHDQRLFLVVGDEERGQTRAGAASGAPPAASARAACGRARRTARRAAAAAAETRWRGRAPRAAAGRPRAACGRRSAMPRELDHLQGFGHPLGDLRLCHAPHGQRIGDVAGDAHMREQGIVLEHHADVALRRIEIGDVRAVDQDAARIRRLEAGDDLEQRRLARAAGAKDGDELAGATREAHVGEGHHLAETLARPFDVEAARLRCHTWVGSLLMRTGHACRAMAASHRGAAEITLWTASTCSSARPFPRRSWSTIPGRAKAAS